MLEAIVLAAAAAFRPPLGVALAYVSREDRVIDGRAMHFESHRHLTFARAEGGFVVTIRFDKAEDDAGGDVGAMFQAAMARLSDRAVTLHLDAAGAVTGIDDLDGLWSALCDAIAHLPVEAGQRQRAAAFADALRALPDVQRAAMLGSLVSPLVAGAESTLFPGPAHPVSVRARPPAPAGTTIAGTQTVSRDSDGRLHIHVSAAGDAAVADGARAHVSSERDRLIDPATGLVLATREHVETRVGDGVMTTDTSTEFSIPVS